jgi:hypothetical protein
MTVTTETPEMERTGLSLSRWRILPLSSTVAAAKSSELLGGFAKPNSRHAQFLARVSPWALSSPAVILSKIAR